MVLNSKPIVHTSERLFSPKMVLMRKSSQKGCFKGVAFKKKKGKNSAPSVWGSIVIGHYFEACFSKETTRLRTSLAHKIFTNSGIGLPAKNELPSRL